MAADPKKPEASENTGQTQEETTSSGTEKGNGSEKSPRESNLEDKEGSRSASEQPLKQQAAPVPHNPPGHYYNLTQASVDQSMLPQGIQSQNQVNMFSANQGMNQQAMGYNNQAAVPLPPHPPLPVQTFPEHPQLQQPPTPTPSPPKNHGSTCLKVMLFVQLTFMVLFLIVAMACVGWYAVRFLGKNRKSSFENHEIYFGAPHFMNLHIGAFGTGMASVATAGVFHRPLFLAGNFALLPAVLLGLSNTMPMLSIYAIYAASTAVERDTDKRPIFDHPGNVAMVLAPVVFLDCLLIISLLTTAWILAEFHGMFQKKSE